MSGWQVADVEADAQAYADKCWAAFIARRDPARIESTDRAKIATTTDADAITAKQAIDAKALVVYGKDHLGNVVTDRGSTVAWAVPRETAKGQWAVPCLDDNGGVDEPQWPETPPLDGEKASAAEGLSAEVLHERG